MRHFVVLAALVLAVCFLAPSHAHLPKYPGVGGIGVGGVGGIGVGGIHGGGLHGGKGVGHGGLGGGLIGGGGHGVGGVGHGVSSGLIGGVNPGLGLSLAGLSYGQGFFTQQNFPNYVRGYNQLYINNPGDGYGGCRYWCKSSYRNQYYCCSQRIYGR